MASRVATNAAWIDFIPVSSRRAGSALRPAWRGRRLRDTPHAPFDVPACLSWDPDRTSRCRFARPAGGHSDVAEFRAETRAGVPADVYADPTPAVCPHAVCPAVFGGQITYRDDNHLTARFVALRWRQFAAALHLSGARRPI